MKHLIHRLVFLALILGGAAAEAAPREPGFMARLSVGGGYATASLGDGEVYASARGVSGAASLSVGGFVTRNLALTVDVAGMIGAPSGWFSTDLDDGRGDSLLAYGTVGAGVSYHFRGADMSLGASLGAAYQHVAVAAPGGQEVGLSGYGVASTVTLGRDFHQGDGWTVGMISQVSFAFFEGDSLLPHVFASALGMTLTFH